MSNPLESLSVASLDAAQQAFEHWRHTRTQRSPTPEALRIQAVSLIDKHRRSHICTALRINDQALKQWERKIAGPDTAQRIERQFSESTGNNEAFVELAVHKVPVSDVVTRSIPMTAIHIDLPNGTVIREYKKFKPRITTKPPHKKDLQPGYFTSDTATKYLPTYCLTHRP